MTTWQEDVQKACAATFTAWGGLVEAWSTALMASWASVVDWAVDEDVVAPPNATALLLYADRPTRLTGAFRPATDPDGAPLPTELVTFDPPAVPAMPPGSAVQVIVRISPGPTPAAGGAGVTTNSGYVGHVLDDLGRPLTTTPAYVAVHVPWELPTEATPVA